MTGFATPFQDADLTSLPIVNPGSGRAWNNSGLLAVGNALLPAFDADVVHIAGAETITGQKTLTDGLTVNNTNSSTAYALKVQYFGASKFFIDNSGRVDSYNQFVVNGSGGFVNYGAAAKIISDYGTKIRNAADTADAPITAGAATFSGYAASDIPLLIKSGVALASQTGDFLKVTDGVGRVVARVTGWENSGNIQGRFRIGSTGTGMYADGSNQLVLASGEDQSAYITGSGVTFWANRLLKWVDTTWNGSNLIQLQTVGLGIGRNASGVVEINNGTLVASGGSYGGLQAGAVTLGVMPATGVTGPLNIKSDGAGTGFVIANSAADFTRFISGGTYKGLFGSGAVPMVVASPTVKILSDAAVVFKDTGEVGYQDIFAKAATFSGLVTAPAASGYKLTGSGNAVTITANAFGDTLQMPYTVFQSGMYVTNGDFLFRGSGNMRLGTGHVIGWKNNSDPASGSLALGLGYSASGVLEINNGTTIAGGGSYGNLKAGAVTLTGDLTLATGTFIMSSDNVWRISFTANGYTRFRSGLGASSGDAYQFFNSVNTQIASISGNGDLALSGSLIRLNNLRTLQSTTQQYKVQIFNTTLSTYQEIMRHEASASGAKWGVFGNAALQQTGGIATAGAAYTGTEQAMLQKVYDTLRVFGLLS